MSRTLIAALLLGAATAATGAHAAEDSIETVAYACPDNSVLRVAYVNTAGGNSYAILLQMDELIAMKSVMSGSGARYQAIDPAYTYILHTKGDVANLYEGDDKPVVIDCKS